MGERNYSSHEAVWECTHVNCTRSGTAQVHPPLSLKNTKLEDRGRYLTLTGIYRFSEQNMGRGVIVANGEEKPWESIAQMPNQPFFWQKLAYVKHLTKMKSWMFDCADCDL